MPNYFGSESKHTGPDYFKKKPTTKISHKHEKEVAIRSGGKRVPGSGNILGIPGDVSDSMFLRECKATNGGGTQIQAKWIQNISQQALLTGKIPLIELRFAAQEDPAPKDWVLIPAIEFESILQRLRKDK